MPFPQRTISFPSKKIPQGDCWAFLAAAQIASDRQIQHTGLTVSDCAWRIYYWCNNAPQAVSSNSTLWFHRMITIWTLQRASTSLTTYTTSPDQPQRPHGAHNSISWCIQYGWLNDPEDVLVSLLKIWRIKGESKYSWNSNQLQKNCKNSYNGDAMCQY